MCTKLEIEAVKNGFIVSHEGDDYNEVKYVFSNDTGMKECVVDLLNFIKEHFGYAGSKHDVQRIYVKLENQHDS